MKDFCISLFKQEQEEKATKIYYAECLRIMSENTARFGGGGYIQVKLSDRLDPKPVDNRTANEIIDGIKDKIEKMNDEE